MQTTIVQGRKPNQQGWQQRVPHQELAFSFQAFRFVALDTRMMWKDESTRNRLIIKITLVQFIVAPESTRVLTLNGGDHPVDMVTAKRRSCA
jgi:hypothetical protein